MLGVWCLSTSMCCCLHPKRTDPGRKLCIVIQSKHGLGWKSRLNIRACLNQGEIPPVEGKCHMDREGLLSECRITIQLAFVLNCKKRPAGCFDSLQMTGLTTPCAVAGSLL